MQDGGVIKENRKIGYSKKKKKGKALGIKIDIDAIRNQKLF